ncbi:HEPN domain-containing protein [Olivibacter sitiensis]|uniref:HEPN domain-containing protein n=1 Tax=Olivibacter sitiensis TaxID=376470 RepID=UPI00042A40AD|nr:HEPN domain-containing protein [Olivibacter sitiensis]
METSIFNRQILVERLISRMDLNRVFLFSYPYMEEERQHLLLVVNPLKGLSPKAMAPIVSLCMSDMEEIPFDMILAGEWQNHLKQGSLYYTYASLPRHELFAAPKKKSPLFSHKTIMGLLELSRVNYEKCAKNADEFREGVDNFLARNDYGQATFMLHQFLELRLKGFQSAVGLNGGKSHNIEHLIKSVRAVAPQLLSIFPYDSPSVELFRLLDQSYLKAKKQETVEITPEEFDILLEKCKYAQVAMDSMVASMVERITAYREQLPQEADSHADEEKKTGVSKPTLATTAAPMQIICEDFSRFPWPEQYKQDANALLDSLRQKHNPEQIRMLNYHTGGFSGGSLFQHEPELEKEGAKVELYLVVLMKSKGPFNFRCLQVGMASARVLYLNLDYVKKKLAEGHRFVHTLWTKGWVLRKKSTFEPDFAVAEVDWKDEYERLTEIWQNAKTCMENILSLIESTENLPADVGLQLLSDLFAIGLHTHLYFAVGFIPKQVNLDELFDWSGVTGRTVIEHTASNNKEETRLFHLTLHPRRIWWESGLISADWVEWYAHDKAQVYFKLFSSLCNGVLKEVEHLAKQTNVLS